MCNKKVLCKEIQIIHGINCNTTCRFKSMNWNLNGIKHLLYIITYVICYICYSCNKIWKNIIMLTWSNSSMLFTLFTIVEFEDIFIGKFIQGKHISIFIVVAKNWFSGFCLSFICLSSSRRIISKLTLRDLHKQIIFIQLTF